MNSEQHSTSGDVGTTPSSSSIHVEGLAKEYETRNGIEQVFDDVSFTINEGSFVTLIGRSGSGKSTLLSIVSGIQEATKGRVRFESSSGDDITLGHVFQEPRLLPWNTCVQNIEFVHEDNDSFSEELAKEYLDLVGLDGQYDKFPTQLSGGQQQRVGIARALSIDPEILLMDEPFSNLDEITAAELRKELISIWSDLGKTVFFVTHDITEAVELSDRILMLGDGEIYSDISVDLERPRTVDSEEFLTFQQHAIEEFHAIKKTAGADAY
ncbi:ABC transporter ATP-binding protein [Natrarchaeobius halalkaliphilus]|nr:ABC transporter ATP-binding protein [Natrarchaeobius halalkaliphilus]